MTPLRSFNLLRGIYHKSGLPLNKIPFPPQSTCITTRGIFEGWLNGIFNRVDSARITEVGPDRAASEWLLRCGASVRWINSEKFIKDYNMLPIGGGPRIRIEEIDATNSSIMQIGFPYLKGLACLRKIKFENCL